ncbi:MAG: hypothetical protein ABIF85_06295 [Nanoarchaeota archaeon]|nr:hypothetical protein [Nanoarchaeota archaeon]
MTVSNGLDKNAEPPSPQKYRLGILLCVKNGIFEPGVIANVLQLGPHYTANLMLRYQGLLSKDGGLKTDGISVLETLEKEYAEQTHFYRKRMAGLSENGEISKNVLATKEPYNSTGRDTFTPSNPKANDPNMAATIDKQAIQEELFGSQYMKDEKEKTMRCFDRKDYHKARLLYQVNQGNNNNAEIAKILGISTPYVYLLLAELERDSLFVGTRKSKKLNEKGAATLSRLTEKYGALDDSQKDAPHTEYKQIKELIKKPSEPDTRLSQNLVQNQVKEEIKPAKVDTKISDIIGVNDGLPANELSDEPEYVRNDLLVLKLLMGVESGLKADELSDLLSDDGGLYTLESRLRKEKLFSKKLDVYRLEGSGRKKLDSLKQECSTVVPEYADIIDYLRVNKMMPPQKKNAYITAPAGNAPIAKDEKLQEISKSEHEKPKYEKEETPYVSKETVVEASIEKNPIEVILAESTPPEKAPQKEQRPHLLYPDKELFDKLHTEETAQLNVDSVPSDKKIAEIIESHKFIDVEESSAEITYSLNQGYVRITDGMAGFNLLKINNSYNSNPNPSDYGMRVKLSPELVLLELVKRTKSTKKDLMHYADTYNKRDWVNSTRVLKNGVLIKESEGMLTLTENAMKLLDDAEYWLSIYLRGEDEHCTRRFDEDESCLPAFIRGVGKVSLHSPSSTVLNKIKEYCAIPKIGEKEEQPERTAFVKPEPVVVYEELPKIKPVVAESTISTIKKNGDSLKDTGIYVKGHRYVVFLGGRGQRTIVARNRFQDIGKKYLNALKTEGLIDNNLDETYLDLKDLGWITDNNVDKVKTDKGQAAERILEQLMSSSNVVA